MLTLYHFGQAVCARKVRLALAEKELDYESRLLSRSDLRSSEYLTINPNGYVPSLIHDGQIVVESRTISEYLEDAFPAPSLMPRSPLDRAEVRNWTKRIDDSLHLYIYILSFIAMPAGAALQAASLPLTPVKRQVTLDLMENGPGSPFFPIAVSGFKALLEDMDNLLSRSEWMSGETYGFADADYTPYLRRLEEIGLWHLLAPALPAVRRWFDVVQGRSSYEQAITAWETDADREQEAQNVRRARPLFEAALERC